ncbi:hypothetical protein M5D96_010728 [Drosophila gunungcola]|uniref:Uncharacterized protein n=1 Tax=Drosophila gunungcola TaxID=103775 RepID=A0A9P9YG99_9MUSC|nr:hypothetical protein M5D96_010728 [Drosophila gunungcola]
MDPWHRPCVHDRTTIPPTVRSCRLLSVEQLIVQLCQPQKSSAAPAPAVSRDGSTGAVDAKAEGGRKSSEYGKWNKNRNPEGVWTWIPIPCPNEYPYPLCAECWL